MPPAGASVDLTVLGGVSLVGDSCPGLVTLQCTGVDINQLRWRYNGANDIIIYSADDSPSSTVLSQTAFLEVQLTAISQNLVDLNRANYSSILTANLSRLQTDDVMEIECGDSTNSQTRTVEVQIIERSRPRNPSIAMVTALYQSEGLDSVQIEWSKSVS